MTAKATINRTKSVSLQSLRYLSQTVIADLEGLKQIIRVQSARRCKWYLVLPSVGDEDARCVLLSNVPNWELKSVIEERLLLEYRERLKAIHCSFSLATFPEFAKAN